MKINPFAKPKVNTNLTQEIGVTGDAVFASFQEEMTSLSRERKIADYRKMLMDGTVESLINIVTMTMLAANYQIEADAEAGSAGEEQAEFVRNNLLKEGYKGGIETPFDLFLDQAMMALVDGFQVWEKVYRARPDGKLELKKLARRDSRSLELIIDKKNGYDGVKQTLENGQEVIIPAYKTLLFTYNKRYDLYYGRSALTSLWANYDKKQKLEYLDGIALQNDAIKPKVLKQVESGLIPDEKQKSTIRSALGRLARLGKINPVASIPYGFDLEVLSSDGRDPHQSIERQNSEMARVFLANFMFLGSQGSSSTGSFALSSTQSDIFHKGLQSIIDHLAAHINQFLIADLIDINFARPAYPTFKFDRLDDSLVKSIFSLFTTLAQKDRVSDAMAKEIENNVANQLGFDLEKLEQSRLDKPASNELHDHTCDHDHNHKLSDSEAQRFKKLDQKWREVEQRFLGQIRPVYEAEAERIAEQLLDFTNLDEIKEIKITSGYNKVLTSIFKQGFQVGKISASDEAGIAAPKTKEGLSRAAREYIDWIVDKQQADLASYLQEEASKAIVLADKKSGLFANLGKALVVKKISNWFFDRMEPTGSYLVSQAVNSGRNSLFEDDDLVEFSAILDERTTAGCLALDGKVMPWREWKQNPELIAPRHHGCRSIMVKIYGEEPPIDRPDMSKMQKIDYIQTTSKPALIDDGELKPGETKAKKLKQLSGVDYSGMTLKEIEADIRYNSVETMVGLKPSGEVIGSNIGSSDNVSIPLHVVTELRKNGGVITHNHPRSSSFSDTDLITASKFKVDEIRVISRKYEYSARVDARAWPKSTDISNLYDKYIIEYTELETAKHKDKSKIDIDEMFIDVSHKAVKRLCKELGIIYKRRKL